MGEMVEEPPPMGNTVDEPPLIGEMVEDSPPNEEMEGKPLVMDPNAEEKPSNGLEEE